MTSVCLVLSCRLQPSATVTRHQLVKHYLRLVLNTKVLLLQSVPGPCLCRLQPSAIVTDEQCAACDFNRPGKTCLRPMEWVWRGEHYSATSAEYNSIKAQLASESFPPQTAGDPVR